MGKRLLGTVALAVLAACGESPSRPPTFPAPAPSPTPEASLVVEGRAEGPTRITFVSADPRPGSAVSGCGGDARGCAGRVRMVFRLVPTGTGHVLRFAAFMNAPSKQACFMGSTGPFDLRAGDAQSIQVVLDPESCPTPFEITDLAANVEGTIEVASRQEWGIGYVFAP